jgi:hypothetical protein
MDASASSAELGKVRRPVSVILDCNYLSFRVVGGGFYSDQLALCGGFGVVAIAFGLWRLRVAKAWLLRKGRCRKPLVTMASPVAVSIFR